MLKKRLSKQNDNGWLLISALVMMIFLTALGLAISQYVAIEYQDTSMEEYTQNAQLTAEAGIEQTVNELNTNSSFTGYSSPQQFFDNSVQGVGYFTTSITNNASNNSKTIVSTSTVYQTIAQNTTPISQSIKVTVAQTQSSGYSVLSGPGGLILNGSANIENSSVYVGGSITLTGATQIGSYNSPLTVDVGNDSCPTGSDPGPTYPTVCDNGTQPISLDYSTKIYGSVCATGQTSTGPNNNIQGGSTGQGLEAGCTAPVAHPPTYNRPAQIDAVTTTASASDSQYDCSGNKSITWPSNLELTGNVTVGNSCKLTIDGNVYITGSLTIDGAARVTVANSAGTTQPVIMTNGVISVGGSAQMLDNSDETGIDFISFDSTDSCTTSTTDYCSSLTGNELQQSQTLQTIYVGGAVKVPGMIFDAYWGEVTISGSGSVGAATGQTVDLDGAGSVVFGTQLNSNSGTWTITSYEPNF